MPEGSSPPKPPISPTGRPPVPPVRKSQGEPVRPTQSKPALPTPPKPPEPSRKIPVSGGSPATLPPLKPATPTIPPNVPRTARQREAQASLQNDEVIIRTMQDDLRAIRGKGTPLPPPEAGSVTKAPRFAAPTLKGPISKSTQPAASVIPLAPKKISSDKVVMPPIKRHHRSRAGFILFFIFLLLVLAGGGAAAWWYGLLEVSTPSSGDLAAAEQILPRGSALILHYDIADTEARNQLLSAWRGEATEASITTLLAGDPRVLLEAAGVDSFYYVLLEDETRPYLVLAKTAQSEAALEGTARTQVGEIEGWFVVHSVGTESYMNALKDGSLAQLGEAVFVSQPTTSEEASAASPLRIFLGPHALISLRESLLGNAVANGLLQELSLMGAFVTNQPALAVSGEGNVLDAVSAAPNADHQILSLIPEEAEFIHLGGNFHDDLMSWAPTAGVVDMALLTEARVAALLQQMRVPYGFYSVSPNPAVRDIGIIISLPATVQGEVTLSSPVLENALGALVPLISGRKTVGAIEFNSNTHAGVPLRYANFSQPSQALDYAIVGSHLIITTSRESMFAALETATAAHVSVTTSGAWQKLLAAWGALPASPHLLLGTFGVPHFAQLFPTASNISPLFGLAVAPGVNDTSVTSSGVFVLPSP